MKYLVAPLAAVLMTAPAHAQGVATLAEIEGEWYDLHYKTNVRVSNGTITVTQVSPQDKVTSVNMGVRVGTVVGVASGTGTAMNSYATRFPGQSWTTSDGTHYRLMPSDRAFVVVKKDGRVDYIITSIGAFHGKHHFSGQSTLEDRQ